mgnify:FL=1
MLFRSGVGSSEARDSLQTRRPTLLLTLAGESLEGVPGVSSSELWLSSSSSWPGRCWALARCYYYSATNSRTPASPFVSPSEYIHQTAAILCFLLKASAVLLVHDVALVRLRRNKSSNSSRAFSRSNAPVANRSRSTRSWPSLLSTANPFLAGRLSNYALLTPFAVPSFTISVRRGLPSSR